MKYKKALNKKTHKSTKDLKFIITQTLIMKLYNTFNFCRLSIWSQIRIKKVN